MVPRDKAFGVYTCVYDGARERGTTGWREAKGRSREAILVYSRRASVVGASGGSAGVALAILPTGSSAPKLE